MPQMAMLHSIDPAKEIVDKLGNELEKIEVFNDMVLLGVYQRPSVTKGGIHVADQTRDEDKWQGKAALILKMGPLVNVETKLARGAAFEIGDWVAIRPSEGWAIDINRVLCRMLPEKHIHMRIPAPDLIF